MRCFFFVTRINDGSSPKYKKRRLLCRFNFASKE